MCRDGWRVEACEKGERGWNVSRMRRKKAGRHESRPYIGKRRVDLAGS
jgi:hypothetical protein